MDWPYKTYRWEKMTGHIWQRIPNVSDGNYWSWGYLLEHNNPRTDYSAKMNPAYFNNPHCTGHSSAIYQNQPGVCGAWTGEIFKNNP
jgi:hypothetical protein